MADFFASSFWTGFLWPLIVMVAESVLLLVVLLIAIAYILLADRKIWAAVQIRRGPNVVGPWGLFQSFADLLKFVLKEPVIPSGSNKGVFLLAPLVSYEVSIGFVIITVLLCVGSLNLTDVVQAQNTKLGLLGWYWLPLFPMFVIFYVSALAETNRPPFDLVEAESELVAGFMVEYGSTPYLLFMLGEYVAITTMCALATIMFLGGWLPPIPYAPFTWVPGVIWFVLKVFFMFFLFAMAKAIVPRYRYDQLMRLGWKVFLPLSLAAVVVVAAVLQFSGLAPK